ncbi:MAG: MFS transporter [Chloroflexi bacterium]|nr:MFS transporter [Chloroflexota bacterium]MDA1241067.1 MFS transporter [Chloroflexota bacterium]
MPPAPGPYPVTRNVRLLDALSFAFEFSPLIAIWVVYLTDFRHLTLVQVGLMEGLYWLIKLALEVPSGAFADRYGRRLAFIIGALAEITGLLIFALADNFTLLALSYVFWSGGLAFRSGNNTAYLYDALAAGDRQAEYGDRAGVMGALSQAGFMVGALYGGVVAGLTTLQIGVLAGLLTYVIQAPLLVLIKEPPRVSITTAPLGYAATLTTAVRALRERAALRNILLLEIALTAFFPAYFLLAQPFLSGHDVPLALFGVLFLPIQAAGAAGMLLSGRTVRWLGLRRLLLGALLAIVAGLMLIGIVDHVAAIGGLALSQFAFGLAAPAIGAYVNDRTESDVRATILSVAPLGTSITFATVAPIAGILGDGSLRVAFGAMGAAIFVLAGLAYAAWLRADARASGAPADRSD